VVFLCERQEFDGQTVVINIGIVLMSTKKLNKELPKNEEETINESIENEIIEEAVEEDYFMEQTLAQERLRKTFKFAPQIDTPQMTRVKRSAELPNNRISFGKK